MPHHGGLASEEAPEDGGSGRPAGDRDAARIEEERRLMYVAVTRAQRSLTLTWCRERKRGRERFPQLPSRFLEEMQLDVRPKAAATITADAAKARLAGLRELLGKPRGLPQGA